MFDGIISPCLINCIHIIIHRTHSIVFGPDQQYPCTLPHKLNHHCSVLHTENHTFFFFFFLSFAHTHLHTPTQSPHFRHICLFYPAKFTQQLVTSKKIKMKKKSNRSRCDKDRLNSQLTKIVH